MLECVWRRGAIVGMLMAITACAPHFRPPGPLLSPPEITEQGFRMADAVTLPFRAWVPTEPTFAVIVALHGFNDYSRAFEAAGQWWASQGVHVYAYDQRGFGETENTGYWPTSEALADDLHMILWLVRKRHPGVPVFVLGESMGGAVALAALTGDTALKRADGVILAAPAVWGWSSMNLFYQIALWTSAHLFPGMELTGESLDIMPSDNIAMLRELATDPLVIKETRVDAIYGLVNLMERASDGAAEFKLPTLLLYGEKDEIIPRKAVARTERQIPRHETIWYDDGYHMLLRDCQAPRVWHDVLTWITDRISEFETSQPRHDLEIQPLLTRNPQCSEQKDAIKAATG